MRLYTLIPILPLLASITIVLAGRRLGESSHRVAIPAAFGAFILSVAAFVDVLQNGPQSVDLYRLFRSATLTVDFGLYLDQLTVFLLLLVTGVGSVIHVYSSRYMTGDPRYSRFFAVVALFTAAMVMLVMSRNLLMTYMCWEVMGICSYLLISHWAGRKAAAEAATRAFLVNAVADTGLGLGVILTFRTFGTLDIPQILQHSAAAGTQPINLLGWAGLNFPVQAATLIMLLLFMGALGKSAQVPFHVWLPHAMEAPTPVSALIHAATMVNAGPFLLVRFSPLLILSPFAMGAIAVVGGVTALFAAFVALTQTDIKKILAYSTISHIGFMVMACGVGAFAAAVFHLLAHGFLKAFLFLSTGNALQALATRHSREPAHEAHAPASWAAFVGAMVFSCIPPLILFSGPYEAMWTLHRTPAAQFVFWIVAPATVFFTAIYLFRGIVSLFQRGIAAPGSWIMPRLFSGLHVLVVFSAAAVLAALLFGLPAWFTRVLAPALGVAYQGRPELFFPALWPFLAAPAGCVAAWLLHRRQPTTRLAASGLWKGLYVLFLNKLYFDELYHACFVRPNLRFARRLLAFEIQAIDRGSAYLAASSVRFARWLSHAAEEGAIDRAVRGAAAASHSVARWVWRALEGRSFAETTGRPSPAAGQELQPRRMHTLQEHLSFVVSGLVWLIGLFYLLVLGGAA